MIYFFGNQKILLILSNTTKDFFNQNENTMKSYTFILACLFIANFAFAQDLPEQFDLRDYNGENYVTSVKSQIDGTCWAHGAVAAIEGNLIMNGNWTNAGLEGEPNLAEYHLDWWNGFNQEFNQDTMPDDGSGLDVHMGGDYLVTSAYLSRGDGAIKDTALEGYWHSNTPRRADTSYNYFYVRNIEWLTIGDSLERINLLKEKIMENGVMGTCMAYSGQFIDYNYNHYQPPSSDMLPNHAIAIVGWDDNHATDAPQPGAWLCKNSWGNSWGYSGYFWISYYDKWAGREPEMGAISFSNTVEPFFDTIYYHDYHGWRDTWAESNTAMNAFTAKDSISIKAVSFYTAADSVNYTCTVYDDFNTEPSNSLGTVSGFIALTGFHTIDLSELIGIPKGEDFYLELEFDKGGQPFDRTSVVPVLLCAENTRTVVHSTASEGESFYKDDQDQWVDFYSEGDDFWQYSGNFCIKAIVDKGMDPGIGISTEPRTSIDVNVWPQPAKDRINFAIGGSHRGGKLYISNVSGQIVKSIHFGGKAQLQVDMSHLASGIYLYQIRTEDGMATGKLIKQ